MELKEVLFKRRSIRKFKDLSIEKEIINDLLVAAMSGPSACNKRPWEFYVITNKDKLKEIKSFMRFSKYDAPLAIVVCGNLSKALPLQFKDYWIQDCSAATENILLRATDLNLGAVWCGIHPQKTLVEKMQKCLNVSEKIIPLSLILIGYPNEEQEPRIQFEDAKIHWFE